jgi:uncharacterized membrane protein
VQKKIYNKRSERIVDFLLGFFVLPIAVNIIALLLTAMVYGLSYLSSGFGAGSVLGTVLPILTWLLTLPFAIYIGIKRKFIGIGLLFAIVIVPLVFLGGCLLISFGSGLMRYK